MQVIVYQPFLVCSMRDLRVIKLSCSSQILHGFRRSEKYHTNKISCQRIHPNEVIYCIFSFPKRGYFPFYKYVFFLSFRSISFLLFFNFFFPEERCYFQGLKQNVRKQMPDEGRVHKLSFLNNLSQQKYNNLKNTLHVTLTGTWT